MFRDQSYYGTEWVVTSCKDSIVEFVAILHIHNRLIQTTEYNFLNMFFEIFSHSPLTTGVSCDACGKGGFTGKRYKCLTCYDFDLCQDCYESGETGQGRHATDHPMQVILSRVEAGIGIKIYLHVCCE